MVGRVMGSAGVRVRARARAMVSSYAALGRLYRVKVSGYAWQGCYIVTVSGLQHKVGILCTVLGLRYRLLG